MHRVLPQLCGLWLSLVSIASAIAATPDALRDDFEGPDAAWRVVGGDAPHRVDAHSRVSGGAHSGDGCEQLRIAAGHGTYLHLGYDLGRAPVIDELVARLWIRSDRPALQLIARVVLPRTIEAGTGRPRTVLVRGSSYTQIGQWQQLRIERIPKLLQEQARVLRADRGAKIDIGEAFVDRLLLNVYGGNGITQLAIDDLEVSGCVLPPAAEGSILPVGFQAAPATRVELTGSLLLVNGRPFFPRVIDYQGEQFAHLKQLGFNVVRLREPPSRELLEEGIKHSLWLMTPPPIPPQPAKGAADEPIGPEYDGVLVWDVGDGLTGRQLNAIQEWTERIHAADASRNRPLVAGAEGDLRAFSRHADILKVNRMPLGTSLELTDFATWLRDRPRLARPGTPFWCSIQTDLPAAVREQVTLLGGDPRGGIESESLRLVIYTALAAGMHGLCFHSDARLDDTDNPDSVQRSLILELLNMELDLVEPWASSGKLLATLPGSEPELRAALLQTDRARLLLPIWAGKQAQFVPGQSSAIDITVVAPVPESYKAYEITPCELKLLKQNRMTGGTRVVLGEFGLSSVVLLTQDPLVLTSLSKKTPQVAARAARLHRDLAAMKLEKVTSISRQMAGVSRELPHTIKWLSTAKAHLEASDQATSVGNFALSYLEAARAMRPLRLLQRQHFETVASKLPPPVTTPFTCCFATLPFQWQFMDRISRAPAEPNQLPAGNCEVLSQMLNAGWRHVQHSQPEVLTEVELSPIGAHSGKLSLRMKAEAKDPKEPPGQVESSPVWITTAGIPVSSGQLYRIHGWVRVPEPIVASIDGLLIIDSLAGEALAERVGQTHGWQEFTLYRVAPRTSTLTVTFALTGLGEAWLDDVTFEPIQLGPNDASRTATRPSKP